MRQEVAIALRTSGDLRRRFLVGQGAVATIATSVLSAAVLATGASPAVAADACPNAAIRAQQGSIHLPDCRAYELVSPVYKGGDGTAATAISPDGKRVLFQSGGAFAGTPSQDGLFNYYLGTPGASGWDVAPLNLPATEFVGAMLRRFSPALDRFFYDARTPAQMAARTDQFMMREPDGSVRAASPPLVRLSERDLSGQGTTLVKSSADLSSHFLTTDKADPLMAGQAIPSTGLLLYEVFGSLSGSPGLRSVTLDDSGVDLGHCSYLPGGSGSFGSVVSDDGRKIFFTGLGKRNQPCTTTGSPNRVYARVDGARTVELSASECDRPAPQTPCAVKPERPETTTNQSVVTAANVEYRSASRDGNTVVMQTTQQLADSDIDSTIDLYEYRFDPEFGQLHLTQISAGDGSTGVIGTGAKTLGLVRISEDGRRMYFVAEGKLTTSTDHRGNQPSGAAGARNLYLFERTTAHPQGRIRFVGELSSSDSSLWSINGQRQFLLDPTGRFAVFASVAKQTDDDLDTSADIFRYDAVSGEVVRVSHGGDGYDGNTPGFAATIRGVTPNEEPQLLRVVDDSASRILFHTNEGLQDGDVAGSPGTRDVYEWHDGRVAMITGGQDTQIVSNVYGMTPDGSSILFPSTQPLVRPDVDGGTSIYVARVDGGFAPEVPDVPESCVGDGCQGQSHSLPGLGGVGSSVFDGAGSVPDGGPPPAVKPTRLKVTAPRVARGSTRATLRVRVNGGGRVALSGPGVGSASRSVSRAGTYRLAVSLSKRARSTLKRKGRMSTTVRVTYRPSGGRVLTSSTRLTFTAARKGGR